MEKVPPSLIPSPATSTLRRQPTLSVFEVKKENAKIDKFFFLRLSFTSSGTKLYLKANSATAARVFLT